MLQQEEPSCTWFSLTWIFGGLSFPSVELNAQLAQLESWRRAVHNGAVGGKLPVQLTADLFTLSHGLTLGNSCEL